MDDAGDLAEAMVPVAAALIAVAGSFKATVTALAADERAMSAKERRAVGHIENMLRSGVRVHLRGSIPQWHLYRKVPQRP